MRPNNNMQRLTRRVSVVKIRVAEKKHIRPRLDQPINNTNYEVSFYGING